MRTSWFADLVSAGRSQERNACRNGRTDLTIGRETGTVAQRETETLVRFGAQIRVKGQNVCPESRIFTD